MNYFGCSCDKWLKRQKFIINSNIKSNGNRIYRSKRAEHQVQVQV